MRNHRWIIGRSAAVWAEAGWGMLLATGLAVTRWSALLAAILVFIGGTYVRIRSEERLLRGQFGGEFEE